MLLEENPLADSLERLAAPPRALVIFGATGDLARRKLPRTVFATSPTAARCPSTSASVASRAAT